MADVKVEQHVTLHLTWREAKLIGLSLAQVKPLKGADLAEARALNASMQKVLRDTMSFALEHQSKAFDRAAALAAETLPEEADDSAASSADH